MNKISERHRVVARETVAVNESVMDLSIDIPAIEEVEILHVELQETLNRLSVCESTILEKKRAAEKEKELVKANVARRREERRRTLERDQKACIQKELVVWRQIKNDIQERFSDLQRSRRQAQLAEMQSKRVDCKRACTAIVWNLVRLSELKRDYGDRLGKGPVPLHTQREWKELFVADDPLLRIFRLERDKIPSNLLDALVHSDIEDYLRFNRRWHVDTVRKTSSDLLVKWTAQLATEFYCMEKRVCEYTEDAESRSRGIRIAVIGPPCSGRSTICKNLGTRCGIELLNLDLDLIDSKGASSTRKPSIAFLIAVERDECDDPESIDRDQVEQRLLQVFGSKNEKIADVLFAFAFFTVLIYLSQGFVLDGFPATCGEAAALEKQLTGLDLAAEAEMAVASSKLVPPGLEFLPDLHRKCTSGLDVVFLLCSVDADVLLKRAIERERSTPQTTTKIQRDETIDTVIYLDTIECFR